MKNNKPQVIAVVGPTGSGKTKLAIKIAKKYDGVIISADSRQVYKGLDIGTNKEGIPGEYIGEVARFINGVPQLLINVANPGSRFTLYDWLLTARRLVKLLKRHKKLPIIVGGTGLYISALLSNWELGATDLILRKKLEEKKLDDLQELAGSFSPSLNESDYKNPRRLVRFIEKNLLHHEPKLPGLELDYLVLANNVSLDKLFIKSDQRFRLIFEELINESKEFDLVWLDQLGLDYKIAVKKIKKNLPKNQLIGEYNIEAHRYIRKQQTWWQHHEKVNLVKNNQETIELIDKFLRSSKKLVE